MNLSIVSQIDDQGMRLDIFLKEKFPEFSRTQLQSWILQSAVTCNGIPIDSVKYKVKDGDVFVISPPEPEEATPDPVSMDLDIVYEDDDLLVVNKAAGMVVHPSAGHFQDTLVNGLLHHCRGSLSGIGGVLRPGIVHRLDKDTSGLMVVAKNDFTHQRLSQQFSDKSNGLQRMYTSFSWGRWPNDSGTITTHMGRHPKDRQKMAVVGEGSGKHAITHYEVQDVYTSIVKGVAEHISKVCFRLETGRTHQIRVHALHVNCPLVGDPVYGRLRMKIAKKAWGEEIVNFPRQALHAHFLRFFHPRKEAFVEFSCDFPKDLTFLAGQVKSTKR